MHLGEGRDNDATQVLGMQNASLLVACGIAWGAFGATKARASDAARALEPKVWFKVLKCSQATMQASHPCLETSLPRASIQV